MSGSESITNGLFGLLQQLNAKSDSQRIQPPENADPSLTSAEWNKDPRNVQSWRRQASKPYKSDRSTMEMTRRKVRKDCPPAENYKPFSSGKPRNHNQDFVGGSNWRARKSLPAKSEFYNKEKRKHRNILDSDLDSDHESVSGRNHIDRSGWHDEKPTSPTEFFSEKRNLAITSKSDIVSDTDSVSSGVWSNRFERGTREIGREFRRQIKFVVTSGRENKKSYSWQGMSDDTAPAESEPQPEIRFVGYKHLLALNEKPFHEILGELKPDSAFDAFLQKEDLSTDWLFLVLKIVAKMCSSNFVENKSELLNRVCRSPFLHSVSGYLGEISIETNTRTIANLRDFMYDLSEFYSSVINTMPMVAFEKDFQKLILKTKTAVDFANSQFNLQVEEAFASKLTTLFERIEDYKNMVEKKMLTINEDSRHRRLDNMAPPENFRELSLYPTYDDLTRNSLGFVRPNKVKGSYINVEHYLDVQFRLIREDFIDPWRRGLKQFAEAKATNMSGKRMKSKYESMRLYQKVRFEQIEVTETYQVGYILNFDVDQKLKINWEYCKRFMFGSLLLFTQDNFETFFCATVLRRDVERLNSGQILVALVQDVSTEKDFFKQQFLLAESEVFFEPYYLIMKSLKTFGDRNFPMPKYIIRGARETEFPAYLFQFEVWDILGHRVEPLETGEWPSAEELGLDNYQHRAFKKALTSDFCVIQGPPGTGKTFLGLKIVEVLTKNIRLNPDAVRTPILVVCYTNHALDQFLEGIIRLTNKVVRVGGQSKSEVLKDFNLRGLNQVSIRREAQNLHRECASIKEQMRDVIQQIHTTNKLKTNLENPTGIVRYSILSQVMSSHEKRCIRDDKDLLKWLLQYEYLNETDDSDEEETAVSYQSDITNFKRDSSDKSVEEHYSDEDDNELAALADEDDVLNDILKGSTMVSNYCLTLEKLSRVCQRYFSELKSLNTLTPADYSLTDLDFATVYYQRHMLEKNIKLQTAKYNFLNQKLTNRHQVNAEVEYRPEDIHTINNNDDRWHVYWFWIKQLHNQVMQELKLDEELHRSKSIQYEEYKQIEDFYVVEKAEVVGMTTTCAARLQLLLRTLKPAIVIVEEAAEVLEAHIVTSLTNECEHVILIGDHKQLKPSAAVYQLSKNYNIDVSLFERMINNGMDCPMLNVQHRMRPEISCLISPLIYPDLKNHVSVLEHEPIRGIEKSVFFLEHNVYEQETEEETTRKNMFEAFFILELCRYLVLQGYDASTITILTTYAGQMFLFREKKRYSYPLLKAVKCIVVDKYQGEENEIILLSLVRSNCEAKIGFLKTENRVCVALSRAKKALYIVGNMDNMSQSSSMWAEIKATLEKQNAIGKEIRLYCGKHELYTAVSKAEDFDKVRQGGCNLICGELLPCGHACKSVCHMMDEEHEQIKCREPCQKSCLQLHPCKRSCYEECGECCVIEEKTLACGHTHQLQCHIDDATYLCPIIIDDVSPFCQHPIKRRCSQNPEDVLCSMPCEDRLDCGHACPQTCHKQKDPDHVDFKCQKLCERLNKLCAREHQCMKPCFEDCGLCLTVVEFELTCGHMGKYACSVDLSAVLCQKKCRKSCPDCTGKCRKLCWEDCKPCMNKVQKKIPECGHTVLLECHKKPERKYCVAMCDLNAPCGHKCKAKCSKTCGLEKCFEKVKTKRIESLCGHDYVNVMCYQQSKLDSLDRETFLQYCDEPCNAILKCGDVCAGTCAQCWQGRLHKSCQKKCGKTLICGHSCKFPCQAVCPPCNEACSYRCKHSNCSSRCGVPCVPCQELCEWRCKHSACHRKCGQMCFRKPCYEPCENKLKCGHLCIGFCGETCPPLCRQCNPEVSEIVFGWKDELDARFVLLEDCGHTVESSAFDHYLKGQSEGREIVMKVCPLCKTPITQTLRYMNYVKETYKHILNVKIKIFGHNRLLMDKRSELLKKIERLYLKSGENREHVRLTGLSKIDATIRDYSSVLPVFKQRISGTQLSTMGAVLDLFAEIIPRFRDICKIVVEQRREVRRWGSNIVATRVKKLDPSDTVKKILIFLNRLVNTITNPSMNFNEQQAEDISLELQRFHKMVDYHLVLQNQLRPVMDTYEIFHICAQIKDVLFDYGRLTSDMSTEVARLFEDLRQEVQNDKPLTSEKKRTISKAMSTSFLRGSQSAGHWFLCSKGHYYCITECGDAIQKKNCPDCGEIIGVTHFEYVGIAKVASGIDGATRPA